MIGYHYSVSFTYSVHACFVLRTNDVQLYVARSADPGPAIQWTRRGLTAKTVYCAAAASWMDWIRSAITPPALLALPYTAVSCMARESPILAGAGHPGGHLVHGCATDGAGWRGRGGPRFHEAAL